MTARRRRLTPCDGVALLGAALLLASGCATPPLNEARSQFASGHLQGAEQNLASLPDENKDRVLFLMERGMIRQSLFKYEESTRDWLDAVRLEEDLETHSASKAAASLVVNDRALAFRGFPYEQTLLHTYLAKNYLAEGRWDDAAVEGRNIVRRQENRDSFPEDPYSRYVAGLTFELAGDSDNAQMQYRLAGESNRFVRIDPDTGRLASPTNALIKPIPSNVPGANELVCFLNFGHAGSWAGFESQEGYSPLRSPYAEIFANGIYLGRGYLFASTDELARQTWKELSLRKTSKTATRIALKLAIANAISQNNENLGALVRMGLLAMEQPDDRHWATLPEWMGVARVPCPANLGSFEVVFYNPNGTVVRRMTVTRPITRRGKTWVSFCRDINLVAEPVPAVPVSIPAP
jgi:hypothetical protein